MGWGVILLGIVLVVSAHLYVHKLPTSFWSFLLSFYYRDIHFHGDLPDDDVATIVVANHANAFIDPFALQVALNRPLIRTVRADWLEHWLVKWFARAVGAIPLARLKIDGNKTNHHSFKQLNQLLTQGKWVVVFPEGISHNRAHLKQFKRGAAHIARQYLESTGKPIRVIQLGLYYTDKSRLHSDVWVTQAKTDIYTQPTDFDSLSFAVNQWRDNIQAVLPTTMRRQEKKTLTWLNNCLSSLNEQSGPFIRDYEQWKHNSQMVQFRSWLRLAGIDIAVLKQHPNVPSMLTRVCADLMILISGLPMALLGLISHAPVALLHYMLTKHHSAAEDKWASSAFVIGIPIYSLYWLLTITLLPAGLALLMIASGPYALFYWRHWPQRKRALFTGFSCLSQPNTRETVLNLARQSLLSTSQA